MAVTRIDLVGTFLRFDGAPAVGRIVVTPSTRVLDTAGNVLLNPVALVSILDDDGAMVPITVVASDSADIVPSNVTYRITEEIEGVGVRSFDLFVPSATAPLYPATDLFPSLTLYPAAA